MNKESKLRELSLEIFKINDIRIDIQPDLPADFFDNLQNHVLEKLTIKGSTYKHFILHDGYFASMLRMFKNLKNLELHNISFKKDRVEHFAQALLGPKTERVTINKCAIERPQMVAILKAMAEANTENLRVLNLNNSERDPKYTVKDTVVQTMIECLPRFRSLQRLEMEFAQFALESEFTEFMRRVKVHPQLRVLNLQHCKFISPIESPDE